MFGFKFAECVCDCSRVCTAIGICMDSDDRAKVSWHQTPAPAFCKLMRHDIKGAHWYGSLVWVKRGHCKRGMFVKERHDTNNNHQHQHHFLLYWHLGWLSNVPGSRLPLFTHPLNSLYCYSCHTWPCGSCRRRNIRHIYLVFPMPHSVLRVQNNANLPPWIDFN